MGGYWSNHEQLKAQYRLNRAVVSGRVRRLRRAISYASEHGVVNARRNKSLRMAEAALAEAELEAARLIRQLGDTAARATAWRKRLVPGETAGESEDTSHEDVVEEQRVLRETVARGVRTLGQEDPHVASAIQACGALSVAALAYAGGASMERYHGLLEAAQVYGVTQTHGAAMRALGGALEHEVAGIVSAPDASDREDTADRLLAWLAEVRMHPHSARFGDAVDELGMHACELLCGVMGDTDDLETLQRLVKKVHLVDVFPRHGRLRQILQASESRVVDYVRGILEAVDGEASVVEMETALGMARDAGLDPQTSAPMRRVALQLQEVLLVREGRAVALDALPTPKGMAPGDFPSMLPPSQLQREMLQDAGQRVPCLLCEGTGSVEARVDAVGIQSNVRSRIALTPVGASSSFPRVAGTSYSVSDDASSLSSSCMPQSSDDGMRLYVLDIDTEEANVASLHQVCVVCQGTGTVSPWVRALSAPDADDGEEAVPCLVCYGTAEFGISTNCSHFFCGACVRASLDAMLDQGQFPAFCPQCRADAPPGVQGGPENGHIDDTALGFLREREVIDRDTMFRFMREQRRAANGPLFFKCPVCAHYLEHREPEWTVVAGEGGRSTMVMQPGLCVCTALVCLACHQEVQLDDGHQCATGDDVDDATLATMQRLGRPCPCCGNYIEKISGCDVVMCGTSAHGDIKLALRQGGCGFQFSFSTGEPVNSFYTGVDGVRKTGIVSPEEQRDAMRIIRGE